MSDPHPNGADLSLRPADIQDIPFAINLLTDPKVRQFLGGPVSPTSARHAAETLITAKAGEVIWCALHRSTETPIGLLSLTHHKDGQDIELSYQFRSESWGKDLAHAACRTLLAHGFRHLNPPRIIAETQTANTRSRRLLHRLGFTETARIERFGAPQSIMICTPNSAS